MTDWGTLWNDQTFLWHLNFHVVLNKTLRMSKVSRACATGHIFQPLWAYKPGLGDLSKPTAFSSLFWSNYMFSTQYLTLVGKAQNLVGHLLLVILHPSYDIASKVIQFVLNLLKNIFHQVIKFFGYIANNNFKARSRTIKVVSKKHNSVECC